MFKPTAPPQPPNLSAVLESNKTIVHRCVDDFWNLGNRECMASTMATGLLFEDPMLAKPIVGRDKLAQHRFALRTAFPDLHITVKNLYADGNVVISDWTFTGTFKAMWALHDGTRIPPTNKVVTYAGLTRYRFDNGKIMEIALFYDTLGLNRQIRMGG